MKKNPALLIFNMPAMSFNPNLITIFLFHPKNVELFRTGINNKPFTVFRIKIELSFNIYCHQLFLTFMPKYFKHCRVDLNKFTFVGASVNSIGEYFNQVAVFHFTGTQG